MTEATQYFAAIHSHTDANSFNRDFLRPGSYVRQELRCGAHWPTRIEDENG